MIYKVTSPTATLSVNVTLIDETTLFSGSQLTENSFIQQGTYLTSDETINGNPYLANTSISDIIITTPTFTNNGTIILSPGTIFYSGTILLEGQFFETGVTNEARVSSGTIVQIDDIDMENIFSAILNYNGPYPLNCCTFDKDPCKKEPISDECLEDKIRQIICEINEENNFPCETKKYTKLSNFKNNLCQNKSYIQLKIEELENNRRKFSANNCKLESALKTRFNEIDKIDCLEQRYNSNRGYIRSLDNNKNQIKKQIRELKIQRKKNSYCINKFCEEIENLEKC